MNPIYDKRNFDEIDRNSFSRLHSKRNFDKIDRNSLSHKHSNHEDISGVEQLQHQGDEKRASSFISRMPKNVLLMQSKTLPIDDLHKRANMDMVYLADQQAAGSAPTRKFNEINRSAYTDFMKRYFDDDRMANDVAKRNFDEIDRFGFDELLAGKRGPKGRSEGPVGYVMRSAMTKRMDEIDRYVPRLFAMLDGRSSRQSPKRNFDEIDRYSSLVNLRKRSISGDVRNKT